MNNDANVKCTIVMPTYNREEYIAMAIESVLKQETVYRIQLVIADDCSEDGSLQIAQQYKEQYPDKIVVLTSAKNQGLLANDIRVFENMKSDYFCVLDPDDYWIDYGFVQKAIDFLEENRDFTCYSSNTIVDVYGTGQRAYFSTNQVDYVTNSIGDYLEGRALVPHTTASIYRNVIYKNGVPQIIREAVGTRNEVAFRGDHGRFVIHLKYGKAIFVNEFVGVYREYEGGIWSGAKQIHRYLLSAQAKLGLSAFYNEVYRKEFMKLAWSDYKNALAELKKMIQNDDMPSDTDVEMLDYLKRQFEKENFEQNSCEEEILQDELEKTVQKFRHIVNQIARLRTDISFKTECGIKVDQNVLIAMAESMEVVAEIINGEINSIEWKQIYVNMRHNELPIDFVKRVEVWEGIVIDWCKAAEKEIDEEKSASIQIPAPENSSEIFEIIQMLVRG